LETYAKYYLLVGIEIIITIIALFILPSSALQFGLSNAFSIINGLTTSTSIVVAFGGVMNGLMFRELTESNSQFRRKYFEAIGLFLIPFVLILIVYLLLALGSSYSLALEYALKFSISGFLLAFLITFSFYILIARGLNKNAQTAQPSQLPTVPLAPANQIDDQKVNSKLGLNGKIKNRGIFGCTVGSEIELSWEVTNLGSQEFAGGTLVIVMAPANGQYVQFVYRLNPLKPNETIIIDRNSDGNPLTTNVLSSGFTLFSARVIPLLPTQPKVDIYSPPTELRSPETSFLSMLGKTKEEIYSLIGLYLASTGLLISGIIGIIQLIHDFGII
jgi:hypothetical protein